LGEHPETAMRIKSFIKELSTFISIFISFAFRRGKYYNDYYDMKMKNYNNSRYIPFCGTDFLSEFEDAIKRRQAQKQTNKANE